jgi:rare lipoprotein A (peptidoglycan hydrolase)
MRATVLAAVALVAIAGALAVVLRNKHHSDLPAAVGDWSTALAAPYTPSTRKTKSACGVAIGPKTLGVAHPVLPCGVMLYIEYNGRQALIPVIDRSPGVPGREFDLTQALAKRLHLEGTQTIRWRFAQ